MIAVPFAAMQVFCAASRKPTTKQRFWLGEMRAAPLKRNDGFRDGGEKIQKKGFRTTFVLRATLQLAPCLSAQALLAPVAGDLCASRNAFTTLSWPSTSRPPPPSGRIERESCCRIFCRKGSLVAPPPPPHCSRRAPHYGRRIMGQLSARIGASSGYRNSPTDRPTDRTL